MLRAIVVSFSSLALIVLIGFIVLYQFDPTIYQIQSNESHHLNHSAICPSGWKLFSRTPSTANSHTRHWCLKVIGQRKTITIDKASLVCSSVGGVLSAFENSAEQLYVKSKLSVLIPSFGVRTGSIAVDGRRIPQCNTDARSVLNVPPCNDNRKVFVMSDNHTDPSYMLAQFAPGEPSAMYWDGPYVESCLAMYYLPNNNSGKINDFYCNRLINPSNPHATMNRNFGVLCGRHATILK